MMGSIVLLAATLPAAPVPAAPPDGLIWLHDEKAGRLLAYRSNGSAARALVLPKGVPFLGLTPDGRKVLYAAKSGGRMTYHARDLDTVAPGTDLGVDHGPFDAPPIWSRDGKRFLRVRSEGPERIVGVRSLIVEYAVFDLAAKKLTPLGLPHDRRVVGWAPDDKGLVTVCVGWKDNGQTFIHRPGREPVPLQTGAVAVYPNRVVGAADGRTMLVPGGARVSTPGGWRHAVWTIDAATGRAAELIHEPGHGHSDACWSPDGKRLCVLWCYAKDGASGAGWDQCRLTVAKADGTGRVTVCLRDKAKGQGPDGLQLLGWFTAR
jgi:dipeptidyl aminopeptidase/acylaminoacyl peptidase